MVGAAASLKQMRFHSKRETLEPVLIAGLFFLVALFLYLPYLIEGRMIGIPEGDAAYYYNLNRFEAAGFQQGDPALWNRYNMLGLPFMADIQTSFFSPVSFLALVLPPNTYDIFFHIISHTIAGFSTFLFLKELGVKNRLRWVLVLLLRSACLFMWRGWSMRISLPLMSGFRWRCILCSGMSAQTGGGSCCM